jgi:hypothetical protein
MMFVGEKMKEKGFEMMEKEVNKKGEGKPGRV